MGSEMCIRDRAHDANVEDVGHVVDGVGALGHDGGRHELENRVLGSANGDLAREGWPGFNHEFSGGGSGHRCQYYPSDNPAQDTRRQ